MATRPNKTTRTLSIRYWTTEVNGRTKHVCGNYDADGKGSCKLTFVKLERLESHWQKKHEGWRCVWGCKGRYSLPNRKEVYKHVRQSHPNMLEEVRDRLHIHVVAIDAAGTAGTKRPVGETKLSEAASDHTTKRVKISENVPTVTSTTTGDPASSKPDNTNATKQALSETAPEADTVPDATIEGASPAVVSGGASINSTGSVVALAAASPPKNSTVPAAGRDADTSGACGAEVVSDPFCGEPVLPRRSRISKGP